MTIIDRFKLELGTDYLTDAEYIVILSENGLTHTDDYEKAHYQKDLLYSVIDVLEIVSNDIDHLRRIATETLTTDAAYRNLQSRIRDIQNRINSIPTTTGEETSSFSLLFRRG